MDNIEDFILKEFGNQPDVTSTVTDNAVGNQVEQTIDNLELTEPSSETSSGEANVSTEEKDKAKPEASSEEENLDWDSFIDDTTKPEAETKSQVDYSQVGEALGFNGVKTQDELVHQINELKKVAESVKSKVDEDLPQHLKDAIDIYRKTGNEQDYLAYLEIGTEDYSTADPIELFEDEVAEMFYNEDGSFREDEFYDYIDSLKDTDKRLRGNQIKREYMMIQSQQKEQLKQKAVAQKNEEIRQIQTVLNKVDSIAGLPVKENIKKQMFEDFVTGKYKQELFNGKDGKQDWQKSMEMYFKAKYFDAIQKYHEHKVKTGTKRSVINSISNSNLNSPSRPDNPVKQNQSTSGVDLYLNQFNKG